MTTANPKTILYIITKSVWGGAAKYVYDLAKNLPRTDFKIQVAAGGRDKFAQEIIKQQVPYHAIKNFQRSINPLKEILAFFEVLKLMFQIKPDIIHTNSSKGGAVAGLAAQIYGIISFRKPRLIFTAHGWAFAENRPKWEIILIKLISKITVMLHHKVICVSEYDRQIAIKHKIAPHRKLVTIHNGIDTSSIDLLPRKDAQLKLIDKTSPFIIGTLAEWTQNKGIKYLIRALAIVKKRIPDFQFDVVLIKSGENPHEKEIYKAIHESKLNIYVHGKYLPNAVTHFKALDIFVLPSIKEGLPYTVLEAMFAQIPVIATTVGGIPEIIDNNVNGILIKPKNTNLLAEKIISLINNPQKAQNMARTGRQKIIKHFSVQEMIKKTKRLY